MRPARAVSECADVPLRIVYVSAPLVAARAVRVNARCGILSAVCAQRRRSQVAQRAEERSASVTLNPQPIVLEVDIIDVIDAEAHTE